MVSGATDVSLGREVRGKSEGGGLFYLNIFFPIFTA